MAARKTKADRREEMEKALQLRLGGATYPQIAAHLAISEKRARNLVEKGLAEGTSEDATLARELELQRIDTLQKSLWIKAKAGDLEALDRIVKLMDRRHRLMGLTGKAQGDPLDRLVRAFQALRSQRTQTHALPPGTRELTDDAYTGRESEPP